MVKDLSELSIQYIKGVGPQRARLLNRLGIKTVRDMLFYFPYRYEDRTNIRKISDLTVGPLLSGGIQTVSGRVIAKDIRRVSKKLNLFELKVSDKTGTVVGKWFNQPFMEKRFQKGQEIILSGVVKFPYRGFYLEMENPEYEILSDDEDSLIHTGRIVPVYRVTEGLSSRQLRTIIYNSLKAHLNEIKDPLPQEILKRNQLLGLREAIMGSHFPVNETISRLNSWQTDYQRRVSFDELFMLELGLAVLKKRRIKENGIAFKPTERLISRLKKTLPFTLTSWQEKALSEILHDMQKPYPMNRLLQGDVSSGKTIIAVLSMLYAVEGGYQTTLMAPTELLAEQHYINIKDLLRELGLRICLVTASIKQRPLNDIAQGRVDIVIGTHALIEEDIQFGRLGLIIIDEQHRFGVRQRAVLRGKAKTPDVIIMTATPIPRTLSMTLYGDLDYSIISGLPPNRTPVLTKLIMSDEKKQVYDAIYREVKAGGQVYVVYPIIEESERVSLRSALMGEKALKKRFPFMRVSLIHGRIKPVEREQIMMAFKRGEIDILVSTTVIEVGVDVPNASLMVIVHAERFGLSQLHQLRGRVGRGRRQSTCILLAYNPLSELARRRLNVMVTTQDGFKVSEEDLAIRGPGEMLGVKQSGMPELRIANLMRDVKLLECARKEAFHYVEKNELSRPPSPEVSRLSICLERFWNGKIDIFKTG